MAFRVDRGEFKKAVKRDDGFLVAEGYPTRAGVFSYQNPDGSIRRELRPPEEVFHADSLSSLNMVPLTYRHPPERLTASNAHKYSVGHLGSEARQDGEHVRNGVMVTKSDMVDRVERKDVSEFSCGYRVDLEETPGEHPRWGRYDAIQRNIRYNHCAFVERGRAGPSASIRIDGADDDVAVMIETQDRNDSDPSPTPNPGALTMKVRIDDVEYDVSEQAAQAINKMKSRHDEEVKTLKAETESARGEASEAKGRADAASKELEKVKKERDDAASPESLDKRVRERVDLEREAAPILGEEFKFDGVSDSDVRKAVVQKVMGEDERLDDQDEGYIKGAYSFAVKQAARADGSRADVRRAAGGAGAGDSSADVEKARNDADDRRNKAWQQPLTASKAS